MKDCALGRLVSIVEDEFFERWDSLCATKPDTEANDGEGWTARDLETAQCDYLEAHSKITEAIVLLEKYEDWNMPWDE